MVAEAGFDRAGAREVDRAIEAEKAAHGGVKFEGWVVLVKK